MEERKSKRITKYDKNILAAFFLSTIMMLIFCLFTKYRWGEISSLQAGDMLNLYVPAVRSFVRNLYSGKGLSYSWDLFLGMNAVPYYTSVMGGSFINLLYLIFPFMSSELFVILAIILKSGIVAASFVYYSKKVLKVEGVWAIIFGLFYSFCGFQVCINIINYIWIDLLYLLPLILCAIVDFLDKKKLWKKLVLLYAYSFLCCFYIAYIVGIFSALYLLIHVVTYKLWKINGWNNLIKKLAKYVGIVVWAAAIGAFALIPTAIFLVTKFPPDATSASAELVQQNILLLLSRFLAGIPFTQYFNLPFLYCGILTLLMIPIFFISQKISIQEKCIYGSLFVLMMLSCMNLPLYIVWHGFDAPDGWGFRFTFIISFLAVSMGCKASSVVMLEEKKKMYILMGLEIAVCSVLVLYSNTKNDTAISTPIICNLLFIVVWLLIGAALLNKKNKKIIGRIAIFIALSEVLVNGGLQHKTFQSQKEMDVFAKEMKDAQELLKGDTSFYRVQVENSIHENADSYWGYNGVADLCTFENYEVRNALYQLGFYASPRYMTGYGLNPLTQMMLGVKYNIHFSEDADLEEGAKVAFYENQLGLGFLVDDDILAFSFESDPFENCNNLATAMAGEDIEMFSPVPKEDINVQEAGISLVYQDSIKGYEITRSDDKEEIVQLIFSIPDVKREIYGIVNTYTVGNLPGRPYIYELFHSKDKGTFGMRYTKVLDRWGENSIYDIVMEKDVTEDQDTLMDYKFSYLNKTQVDRFYEIIQDKKFIVDEIRNGKIKGEITVCNPNEVLYTSIPYDKGWVVEVKNAETGINEPNVKIHSLLNGAFLGVEIQEEGTYILSLTYHVPGERMGRIISLVALISLLFIHWRKKEEV